MQVSIGTLDVLGLDANLDAKRRDDERS